MAFNGLQPSSGPYFLSAGGSVRIHVWYGALGNDHGAQWIMAHPLPGSPPAELALSDFSKILDYEFGCIAVNGEPRPCASENPFWRYGVTVTNWGRSPVSFNVQGGGNI